MTQTTTVAALQSAHRIYNPGDNPVVAMANVNLEIRRGDFLALAGPSGSGKSTILNCLGCLDTPTQGRVLILDKDTSLLSKQQLSDIRSQHIGFIFQSFNLIPVLSAAENIEFALQIRGDIGPAETKERTAAMLKRLRLNNLGHRRPSQLSGGQQQRVAIGRALIKNPALVLADEPTANLDRATSEEIIQIMRDMNEEMGVTFVFATHDHDLMQKARRLVMVQDGRIQSDTTQTGTSL
ncbi:MAG: ABC transporter ATP-binding protein [Myxococcales bacterium]|nr:ABC transporter ATP-binding protein [Myxococcales bacterium]